MRLHACFILGMNKAKAKHLKTEHLDPGEWTIRIQRLECRLRKSQKHCLVGQKRRRFEADITEIGNKYENVQRYR